MTSLIGVVVVAHPASASADDATVKLLTVNVWQSSRHFARRAAMIAELIRARKPDVVALQEVFRTPARPNVAELIARKARYHRVYRKVWLEPKPRIEMGLAILARGKILRAERIMLPRIPNMETRGCLFAQVETPLGPIWFANPHLDYRENEGPYREQQVRAIAARMRTLRGKLPPILMGDLNAAPGESPVRFLTGDAEIEGERFCLADAWALARPGDAGFTWDNRNRFAKAWKLPDRRIDYVMLGGSGRCEAWPGARARYRVVRAELVLTEPDNDGVHATDHYGLWVEVAAGVDR